MIEYLYARMAFPDACYLGKRVFKKLFYENADLTTTDKQAFTDDVDSVTWQYTIKPATVPIPPYDDDQREYLEVAILQVDLTSPKRMNRIAEIIHRAIPYPLVIVFVHQSLFAMSMAPKRFSQAERGVVVAEEFLTTGWMNLDALTPVEAQFLDSLAVSALPFAHLYAFYSALTDRVIAVESARLTGGYRLEPHAEKRESRREALAASRSLQLQVAQLKAEVKKETQFRRQVELNTKIKQLEQRLRQLIATL